MMIAAFSVIFGVNAWRIEYVGKRRYDLAEETLALFYESRDAISQIRSPSGYGGEGSTRKAAPNESPEEKQINDQAYVVSERYIKRQELFNKLYAMRYRWMARFGKDSAKPFDDLNKIVNEILISARMLSYYWKQQGHAHWRDDEEFQKHLREMRQHEAIFWERRSDEDPLVPRVDAVVAEIEAQALRVMEGKGRFSRYWQRGT
ncbi:MAG: hypothetical protein HYX97_06930 [Chloroflexi bacterium]|nr:hypothetical protein [Chloroflexota bacterium]